MYTPNTAIMSTGGMDSTVLLYETVNAGHNPLLITVNYGHAAFEKQLELITWHANYLNLRKPIVIDIEYKSWQKTVGLFTTGFKPNEESPLEDWDKLRYQNFFIEGRNMIMVAYVLSYCSAFKIEEVLAGYLYTEKEWQSRRTYKLMTGDNSPQFVDAMNNLTNMGLSHQTRLRAPFYERHLSKEDVYKIGIQLGVDFSKTYSCYFIPKCGVCDNCRLRAKIIKKE